MIVSNFYECAVCNKGYRIRYGVGDQFPQKASFFCKDCGEQLVIGYDKERALIFENLNGISEDFTLEIINLHPEIIIESSKTGDGSYFATLELFKKKAGKGDEGLSELRNSQYSILLHNSLWDKLSQNFRLLNEKRFTLIHEKYGTEEILISKNIASEIEKIGEQFIQGKWLDIYNKVQLELNKAQSNSGYIHFVEYLKGKTNQIFEVAYSIMNEYAKARTEMLNTIYAQQYDHEVEGFSSTAEWDKIEMIYGNLYEKYGDLLFIATGINNINERGNYTLFSSVGFDFQTYLLSDKANRCKNFINNSNLVQLNDFYDSNIRNGTHHKNVKVDKDKQEIILGVGKGGRREQRVSFVKYIAYCNEIYARALMLINIAFKIIY
ncbi:hypothetical protein CMU94_17945 [Elizabethkingia anophelis]|nr:hypothetical protein [Elizabethkingia anophelis]